MEVKKNMLSAVYIITNTNVLCEQFAQLYLPIKMTNLSEKKTCSFLITMHKYYLSLFK